MSDWQPRERIKITIDLSDPEPDPPDIPCVLCGQEQPYHYARGGVMLCHDCTRYTPHIRWPGIKNCWDLHWGSGNALYTATKALQLLEMEIGKCKTRRQTSRPDHGIA